MKRRLLAMQLRKIGRYSTQLPGPLAKTVSQNRSLLNLLVAQTDDVICAKLGYQSKFRPNELHLVENRLRKPKTF